MATQSPPTIRTARATTISGAVRGDVHQIGRDSITHSSTYNQLEVPEPFDELFLGRGLGRLLMVVGLVIALAGFGGWMYLILHAGEIDDPSFDPFDDKILGLSAPIVAFGSFAVGAVISQIGLSLSRAARQRRRELERHRHRFGRRA
jgi:hypothetical protein